MHIDNDLLTPIRRKILFYPCCGRDLELPVDLFASVVSDFYFVDVKIVPERMDLKVPSINRIINTSTSCQTSHSYREKDSGNEFVASFLRRQGEDVIDELPEIGVFFFRGDRPGKGEGSSGVMWLANPLLEKVLKLLVPGGLFVTDGSNQKEPGISEMARFHNQKNVKEESVSIALPFEYQNRWFECVGYVGQRYGPTLMWRVT